MRTAPEDVDLDYVVPQTTISEGLEEKLRILRILHQALHYMLHGQFQCRDEGFLAS